MILLLVLACEAPKPAAPPPEPEPVTAPVPARALPVASLRLLSNAVVAPGIPIWFQAPPTAQPRDFQPDDSPTSTTNNTRMWEFSEASSYDWVVEVNTGTTRIERHVTEVDHGVDHLFLRQYVPQSPTIDDRWRRRLVITDLKSGATHEVPEQACTQHSAMWDGDHLVTVGSREASGAEACIWTATGDLLHRVHFEGFWRAASGDVFEGRIGLLPDDPTTIAHVHPGMCHIELLKVETGQVSLLPLPLEEGEGGPEPCRAALDWWAKKH